jgi:hypothetical protein
MWTRNFVVKALNPFELDCQIVPRHLRDFRLRRCRRSFAAASPRRPPGVGEVANGGTIPAVHELRVLRTWETRQSLHLFQVRNFGHGRIGLASNAKGQPRENQDDQNDASEYKLIDTVEQAKAQRGPDSQRRHTDGKVDQDVRRNVVA